MGKEEKNDDNGMQMTTVNFTRRTHNFLKAQAKRNKRTLSNEINFMVESAMRNMGLLTEYSDYEP